MLKSLPNLLLRALDAIANLFIVAFMILPLALAMRLVMWLDRVGRGVARPVLFFVFRGLVAASSLPSLWVLAGS